MPRGKRASPNHKKEHKKFIEIASRWHTLQIVQNEKITVRSRYRERKRTCLERVRERENEVN